MKRYGVIDLILWIIYTFISISAMIVSVLTINILSLFGFLTLVFNLFPLGIGLGMIIHTYLEWGRFKRANGPKSIFVPSFVSAAWLVIFIICLMTNGPLPVAAFSGIVFELSLAFTFGRVLAR